ncbi:MAG: YvcK family protein [Sporomusaceae bacterium]|nr:YvcK family protein [Sporomusaceae bacterium]
MKLKRWLLLFALGVLLFGLGAAIVFNYQYIGMLERMIFIWVYRLTGQFLSTGMVLIGSIIIAAGVAAMAYATRALILSIIDVLLPEGGGLINRIYEKRRLNRGPAVAVLGGGTGLSVLLRGIKTASDNITAIVTVGDDGGSSGRIRSDLGLMPPGDLRRCLIALADTEPMMEKLFEHRFGGNGALAGHSFGNLFIAAMNEVQGDAELALQAASKVLAVRGQVLPATTEAIRLSATLCDGRIIEGESNIPLGGQCIQQLRILPEDARPVPSALAAIRDADACIIGPGSLYTSVLPNLLVRGIADELRRTKAVKIYICNVMTQPGETDGYTASQHVKAIIDHAGPGVIDYAVVNAQPIAPGLQQRYASQGAFPVTADIEAIEALGVRAVRANIVNETDLVRHDPERLAAAITDMIVKLGGKSERVRLLNYYLQEEERQR